MVSPWLTALRSRSGATTTSCAILRDDSAPNENFAPCFLEEVDEVVEEHAADHHNDENQIKGGDPEQGGFFSVLRNIDMDLADGEPRVGARMARPTGFCKICLVGARGRIRRRLNVVYTMAARAVGNFDVAPADRQAMVAVLEC